MYQMERMSNSLSHRPLREQLIQKQSKPFKRRRPSQVRNYEDTNVFDQDFKVDEMTDPQKYIPRYQQEQQQDKSCFQYCLTCCGNIQICCAHIFACCGCKCFTYQLPTATAGLVEQFGQFHRLLKPGFNIINPCSETVSEVDLQIKIIQTEVANVITKDNVEIKITPYVAFRIVNPLIAHYVLGDSIFKAITQAVIASFRSAIGSHVLEFVLTDRINIVNQVKENAMKMVPNGLKIEQVFMENIKIPSDIEKDLNALAREKRLAEAMLIENKADVSSASLMKQTAELLDTKAAMQIRYLQLIQSLRKNETVVLMDIGVQKKGSY